MSSHARGQEQYEGVSERFRHRRRKTPYIQRNIRKTIQALQAFNTASQFSSFQSESPSKPISGSRLQLSDAEDEDGRQQKRRKTGPSELEALHPGYCEEPSPRRKPLGQVTNSTKQWYPKPHAVNPSSFYSKASHEGSSVCQQDKSPQPAYSIENFLPDTPSVFKRALKVEIFGIQQDSHEELSHLLSSQSAPVDIRCRCVVGIYHPEQCADRNVVTEVAKSSKTCVLRVSTGPDGQRHGEFMHLESFIFSGEEIQIHRTRKGSSGDVEECFGFADKYYAFITLEPAGDLKYWPPFGLADLDGQGDENPAKPITRFLSENPRQKGRVRIKFRMKSIHVPSRQNEATDLKLCLEGKEQVMPFTLDARATWSMPSHLSEKTSLVRPDAQTSVLKGPKIPPSPLTKEPVIESPGRSARVRPNIQTYNLKALSARAQGKKYTERQKNPRPRLPTGPTASPEEPTVTYTLGKTDGTRIGMTTMANLCCPFCGCDHSTLETLRLHLRTNHTSYKFILRSLSPSRPHFLVQPVRHNHLRTDDASRTFQLIQPWSKFDLEKFLDGDDSWLREREGVGYNQWPDNYDDLHESSMSSPVHGSRQSSPNTSNDTDGHMDLDSIQPKPVAVRSRKFYVPETKKQLYDYSSKEPLEPGQEIPSSEDEVEEGWIHAKHRDIIKDFTDVEEDEKEFVMHWNEYINNIQLSSLHYLSDAIWKFTRVNKDWFCQKKARQVMLGRLMENFMLQGSLSADCHSEITDFLIEAQQAAVEVDVDMDGGEKPPTVVSGGLLDCVSCGDTIPQDKTQRVICKKRGCKARYFHRECAEKSKRPISGNWFCDNCI